MQARAEAAEPSRCPLDRTKRHLGPNLTVEAAFPASGDWRLFIEFQTAGTLRTAEMTAHVG